MPCILITYKIRILPVDSFFKDLGEWDMINLGSGVGAVAIDMLSQASKLLFWDRNFVSPSLWADSNRRPVNCGSSRSEEVLRLNNLILENWNTSPILYHFNFTGPPLVSSNGDPHERVLNWSGFYFTWYIWTHALEITDYPRTFFFSPSVSVLNFQSS